jgi:hypothetical protein
MSGRCMPPSNGSFIANTSSGAMSSRYRATTTSNAVGTTPRCPGRVRPCATSLPSPSQKAVVHVVLEGARLSRADNGQRHLLGDREDCAAELLEGDRIVSVGHVLSAPLTAVPNMRRSTRKVTRAAPPCLCCPPKTKAIRRLPAYWLSSRPWQRCSMQTSCHRESSRPP